MRPPHLVLLLLLLLMWPGLALAQRPSLPLQQVKLTALMKDTQKNNLSENAIEVVWWIPPEYWEISLSQQKDMTEAMRDQALATFKDYNIVAVVQGTLADDMQFRFNNEDDVRGTTQLIDMKGSIHDAMGAREVPPKLAGTLAFLKPILASAMGSIGESMYFLVFPGNDPRGDRLIDPLGDGRTQVRTPANTYTFRLPLGSLLPERLDKGSGESFPGDFLYNPYSGAALEAAKPQ